MAPEPTPVHANGVSNGAGSGVPKKQKDAPQEALRLIEKKVPQMSSPLAGVLQLDIGLPDGPIFIAFQNPPKIIKQFDGEPNCKAKIKPLYIKRFVEGAMEPRYGLFKDGFFDQATLPQGDIRLAVKFADMLCPNNPRHPTPIDELDKIRLPKPTEDLDQVRQDIKEFGYSLVANALSAKEIHIVKEAIRQQAAGEVEHGVDARDGGPHAPNQRIWTLINKGQEFHDLLEHPLIDEMIPDMLGDNFLIHSYSANIARDGNVPMMLHTDQVGIQPPVRSLFYGVNIMWFLTDITAENGGTRVFPGSHIGDIAPDDPFDITGTVAAEGPAGTALVFESRLWHATGPNTTTGNERPVILMFFMRSFVRQQENNFLSIRPEVEATMSDRVRRMLGYMTDGAFGGVEGEVREGNFVSRPKNPVGPFRDSHRHSGYRTSLWCYSTDAPIAKSQTLSSIYVGETMGA